MVKPHRYKAAEYGEWHIDRDRSGGVACYWAAFPQEHEDKAHALAHLLREDGIIQALPGQEISRIQNEFAPQARPLNTDSERYVVIRIIPGLDDAEKFESLAIFPKLSKDFGYRHEEICRANAPLFSETPHMHAEFGEWHAAWKDGRITGYIGRFRKGNHPEEALDHAQAMAWFLAVSNIAPKPKTGLTPAQKHEQEEWLAAIRKPGHERGMKVPAGLYHPPVDEPGDYVVNVCETNARLSKFEDWAMEHDFLPHHHTAQESGAHALKAWRNANAASAVNTQPWQQKNGALQLVTNSAPLAYALAIYLHNHKYVDGPAFGRLYWQTNQAVRTNVRGEFTLTIPPAEVVRFCAQFPQAVADKTRSHTTLAPKKTKWRTDNHTPPLFGDGASGRLR